MKYKMSKLWKDRSELDVILVGAGGTGSEMLSKLFQMSQLMSMLNMPKLNITVIDPDIVSHSNIGRQAFWGMCDIGHNKAEVLVARFNNFGGANMKAIPQYFTTDMLVDFLSADIIVTCTDSVDVRQSLGSFADEYHFEPSESPMLWLDTGNGKHSGQTVLGTLVKGDDDMLLPCVHELYPELNTMEETTTPSCSAFEAISKQDCCVNSKVAIEGATLLWQLLRHGELTRHGSVIDIKNGYTTPIEINELCWNMMGLRSKRPIIKMLEKYKDLHRQHA